MYQKGYVEVFVSPEAFQGLLPKLQVGLVHLRLLSALAEITRQLRSLWSTSGPTFAWVYYSPAHPCHLQAASNLTFLASNKAGDLSCSASASGVSAVSWGVFPGTGLRVSWGVSRV